MEDIILISCYPNKKASEVITLNLIREVKKSNKKIILTSHYPVSTELQKKVDYVVYDSNNIISTDNITKLAFWCKEFDLNIMLGSDVGPAVHSNFYNGISFASKLGYKVVHCINYDILINNHKIFDNLYKLSNKYKIICNNIINGDVRSDDYKSGSKEISTTFFTVKSDFYLQYFPKINNKNEYIKWAISLCNNETLEKVYYSMCKPFIKNNKILMITDKSKHKKIFDDVKELISRNEAFTILPIKNVKNKFVIYYNINIPNGFGRVFYVKLQKKLSNDWVDMFETNPCQMNCSGWWKKEFNYDSNYTYKVNLKSKIIKLDGDLKYHINDMELINKEIILDKYYVENILPHNGWYKMRENK